MSTNRLIKKAVKTTYRPQIRSRHPSHEPFRTCLPKLPFKSVVRFGSVTVLDDVVSLGGNRVELNTIDAIENSSDKHLMKLEFTQAGVPTCDWGHFDPDGYMLYRDEDGDEMWTDTEDEDTVYQLSIVDLQGEHTFNMEEMVYPIVTKHVFGSRGTGNKLIHSYEAFREWIVGKDVRNYIVESYFTGTREYRLHVSKDGCFYTNRKMLKTGTPEQDRWYRNDSNSVWILEDNPQFDKPVNWDAIVEGCVKALHAVGLDMGAVDLRVQSSKDSRGRVRENPEFKVIEINSAPSMGTITLEKYTALIPLLLTDKYNEFHPVL